MTDISETDIQSYLDGAADRETLLRIEEYLCDRPGESARLRETRDDMARLRRLFTAAEAHIPDRHIADTARLIVEHTPPRRFANVSASIRVAATVAFLLIGATAVLGIKLSMTVPAFADAGALAYLDVAKDQTATDKDIAADPQRMIEWLNDKTGLVIRVPHAEEHGFSLTRGRLTQFDRHAAGLLVYEDWRRHRVVVFVTRVSKDDPAPHFAIDRSTYINYWSRNGVGVVIAAADEGDLKEFARVTRELIDVSLGPSALLPH
jgi:anti-sigma factor RsiW